MRSVAGIAIIGVALTLATTSITGQSADSTQTQSDREPIGIRLTPVETTLPPTGSTTAQTAPPAASQAEKADPLTALAEQMGLLEAQKSLEEAKQAKSVARTRTEAITAVTGDETLAQALATSALEEEDILKILEKYDFSKNFEAEKMRASRLVSQMRESLSGSIRTRVDCDAKLFPVTGIKFQDGKLSGFVENRGSDAYENFEIEAEIHTANGRKQILRSQTVRQIESGERRVVRFEGLNPKAKVTRVIILKCQSIE